MATIRRSKGSTTSRNPLYLSSSLRQLLNDVHDTYCLAAVANVYHSSIVKIIEGKPVAPGTLIKVGREAGKGRLTSKAPPCENFTLASRVQLFIIKTGGTVAAARQLRVDALPLARLMYGRPTSRSFQQTVNRRLNQTGRRARRPTSPSLVLRTPQACERDNFARSQTAFDLYLRLGTLQAVGRVLNLSRERVRQLIERGVAYGILPSNPASIRHSRTRKTA